MSIESAESFIERMKTDEDFAQKVTECKSAETRMAFVKEAGFDFNANEIRAINGELSDISTGTVIPSKTIGTHSTAACRAF